MIQNTVHTDNINIDNDIDKDKNKNKNKNKNYYVVKKGYSPGIYINWEDCKTQVNGYNGAIYKKFSNYEEAYNFLNNIKNIKNNTISTNQTHNQTHNQTQTHYHYDDKKENVKKNMVARHNPDNNTYLADYTYIFCDGSSIKKNHKSMRCGFGVCVIPYKIKKNSDLMSFFEIESYGKYLNANGTNNFAELNAILFALNLISDKQNQQNKHNNQYCIVCDSSYALDSILIWSCTWKNNNWLTTNNKPVENQELIKEILQKYELLISQNIILKFKHMNSHLKKPANVDSYNYFLWFGNEISDKLAKDETYTIDIEEPDLI